MTRARSSAARFAAPAAFLLAVTVAVLLVRSGLSGDSAVPPAATVLQTTTQPASSQDPTGPGTPAGGQFYEIQEGDTLDGVAARHDTTVEQLLVLNPDVDPVALRIGQRLRVK